MNLQTHNGCITVTNPKGDHRTFQIKTMKKDAKFAPGERVIQLLTGPNNEDDYQGFGFVNKTMNGIKVRLWSSKKSSALFNRFAQLLEEPDKFQKEGYVFQFEARCCKCNRKLTTPESISLGIGPECIKKV